VSGGQVLDADGHIVESGAELERFGWRGSSTGNAGMDALLARDQSSLQHALCSGVQPFSAETRMADMDREGIAVSVNYPTALLLVNQLGSCEAANEITRAYNSWAYETFTTPSGGRVLTMALVNIADPGAAVAEAHRAVVELGAPGVAVPPYAGHLHLDDPSLDPLWALAEELDVPIGVHGGRNTTDPLLPAASFRDQKRYYAMAHPFGQMTAMGDLAIGGVLERFPSLRVAFLEAGIGWARWYADRLDEAAESVHNQGTPGRELERPPSAYLLGGNCFVSCEPDEPGLQDLVRSLGEDLAVFSSDYPHFDCSFPHTTETITKHLPDTDLLQKVTVDNACRLYATVPDDRLQRRQTSQQHRTT
jgi:predicted TIM-barrel fold metal-dependent hydrolase